MRKLTLGRQLLITLWKYGVQFRCSWVKYIVETCAKVILIYILSFIVSDGVESKVKEEFNSIENLFIMYFPSNNVTDALMANYIGHRRTPGATVQSFSSKLLLSVEWDKRIEREPDNYNAVAIIFEEATDHFLNYTIRTGDNPVLKFHLMESYILDDTGSDDFFKRVLALQMVIESAYIRQVTGVTIDQNDPKPLLTTMEYSTGHKAMLLLRFTSWTGLFICTTLFRSIMEEKESGIKMYQNTLGINNSMLWIGRMIEMVVKSILSNAAVAFAMTYVIRYSWWLLWLYLTMFAMKTTAFLFFMSVWFRKSISALIFVTVVWTSIGNVGKFLIIYYHEFDIKITRLVFAFVFPNVGLALGFYNIANLEMYSVQSVTEENFLTQRNGKVPSILHFKCCI